MKWIKPKAVYDGGTCLGTELAVLLDDRKLIELAQADAQPQAIPTVDIVAFGLFDTQVNGGGDVMLNNQPTPEGVMHIATTHRALGTEFLLPTVITDKPDITRRAAEAVLKVKGQCGVLGIHIEGPHISPERRGTHREAFIRDLDDETLSLVSMLREQNCPVLLTLAPECVDLETIAKLSRMGVVVAAGHSAATAEETRAAIDAGLRSATHVHNAMPPMSNRNPGMVGTLLLSDLWCGLIADGHHVARDMLQLTLNARPRPDRMVLVSDAMSTVGGSEKFELYGETICVSDGKLINEAGSLAGAHVTLTECVNFLHQELEVPLEKALSMASNAPFEMMNLKRSKARSDRIVTLISLI